MASRSRSRSRPRNVVNTDDPNLWTVDKLKTELRTVGIAIKHTLPHRVLVKLWMDNCDQQREAPRGVTISEASENRELALNDSDVNTNESNLISSNQEELEFRGRVTTNERNVPSSTLDSAQRAGMNTRVIPHDVARAQSSDFTLPPRPIDNSSDTNSTSTALMATALALQETAKILQNAKKEEDDSYTLGSYYTQSQSSTPFAAGSPEQLPASLSVLQQTTTPFGVAAADLKHIMTVSPEVRADILNGKDVNLCKLLISNYSVKNKKDEEKDERLNRSLSLHEFVKAFNVYKAVMCEKFPQRNKELDAYLTHIIDVASTWGECFYEYHKLFSAKSAVALAQYHIKVDWSLGDPDLRTRVCAGATVSRCNSCGSTVHSTVMCTNREPSLKNKKRKYPSDLDMHGRARIFHEGKELCNNYNGTRGCERSNCRYSHLCSNCFLSHSSTKCRKGKTDTSAPGNTNGDREVKKTK